MLLLSAVTSFPNSLDRAPSQSQASVMRAFLLPIILVSILSFLPLWAQPAAPPAKDGLFERPPALPVFGESLGRLGWEQGVQKCAALKMRLPTPYEMQAAFEAKILKGWDKGMYWTSGEEEDLSLAIVYMSHFGVKRAESKGYANLVRCVK